jgi:hypothetical protein
MDCQRLDRNCGRDYHSSCWKPSSLRCYKKKIKQGQVQRLMCCNYPNGSVTESGSSILSFANDLAHYLWNKRQANRMLKNNIVYSLISHYLLIVCLSSFVTENPSKTNLFESHSRDLELQIPTRISAIFLSMCIITFEWMFFESTLYEGKRTNS